MKANYSETDFGRAADAVGGGAAPSALVERLGIEWDYLAWLALGVAEEVGAPLEEHGERVPNGAEAFTAGFLIGAYLPPDAGRRRRGSMLPYAVDHVRERGRHAVIADFCDLTAVALLEQAYAASLVESVEAPAHERDQLREPVIRLFESGLATGLVLGDL